MDWDLVSLCSVFDEDASHYRDVSLTACSSRPFDPEDGKFEERSLIHGINGCSGK